MTLFPTNAPESAPSERTYAEGYTEGLEAAAKIAEGHRFYSSRLMLRDLEAASKIAEGHRVGSTYWRGEGRAIIDGVAVAIRALKAAHAIRQSKEP